MEEKKGIEIKDITIILLVLLLVGLCVYMVMNKSSNKLDGGESTKEECPKCEDKECNCPSGEVKILGFDSSKANPSEGYTYMLSDNFKTSTLTVYVKASGKEAYVTYAGESSGTGGKLTDFSKNVIDLSHVTCGQAAQETEKFVFLLEDGSLEYAQTEGAGNLKYVGKLNGYSNIVKLYKTELVGNDAKHIGSGMYTFAQDTSGNLYNLCK